MSHFELHEMQCWCRGWCCPQLCRRSTAWRWRRVTASWRIWSLTGPTRFGWWLSTTQAALCPARGSPSGPVSDAPRHFEHVIFLFFFIMVLNVRVCVPPGSAIGACDRHRTLYCHVGLCNTALELNKTGAWTELHLGVLPPVWGGGRRAPVCASYTYMHTFQFASLSLTSCSDLSLMYSFFCWYYNNWTFKMFQLFCYIKNKILWCLLWTF